MKEELLIPSLAALAVALIAGMVSLVVSILSKDQKTSEFRQAWIDGLRDDASQLMAHLATLRGMTTLLREKSRKEVEDYLIAKQGDIVETEMLAARMTLRLNPREHGELIALLREATKLSKSKSEGEDDISLLTLEIQKILKSEWERVKQGESSFVWLKRVSRMVSTIAIAALLWGTGYVLGGLHNSTDPVNSPDPAAAPARSLP